MSVGAAEEVEDVIGRTLDGRFEVKSLLGEGGLGTVYQVHDRSAGRDVALKLLIPRYRGRPERESRLLAEAAMARAIEHPCVVRCIEWGRVVDLDGCPFAAFEIVEGTSLNETLAWNGAFSPLQAAEIVRELANVVQACHAAGIVHRDVSVQNVFLGEEGRLTLIDFSHAARIEEVRERATLHGEIPGTPWFMSPEQARGEHASPGMDVFALGVVGYELLTGKNPYRNVQADIFAELQGREELRQPKIDCRVFTDVPETLADVVNRCLALRAPERSSLEELAEQLDALLPLLRGSEASEAATEAKPTTLQKRPAVIAAGARPAGENTMAQLVRDGVAMPSAKRLEAELDKVERDECLVANKAQIHAAMEGGDALAPEGDGVEPATQPEVSPERSSRRTGVLFLAVGLLLAFTIGVIAMKPTPSILVPAVAVGFDEQPEPEEAAKPDAEPATADVAPAESPNPEPEPEVESEPPVLETGDPEAQDPQPSETPAVEVKRHKDPSEPRRPPVGTKKAPVPPVRDEAESDRCVALRAEAEADHERGASRDVLRKTRERACWKGHAEDRLYLRASALFDQRDYEACARTAERGKSGDNRDLARVCASKAKNP